MRLEACWKWPAALVLAAFISLSSATAAEAVYECGGEEDTCLCGRDNICICDGTCGNCVWHAWHMACCSWGRALPWCTDAGTWDGYAANNGYPMGNFPRDNSIFVCNPSPTCSQWGHVGWVVTAYPNGSFDTTEQYWGGPCGTHQRNRPAGFSTGGFIYNPDAAPLDDAGFVSETVPDGTHFEPGEAFIKRWTMRNMGNTTWTPGNDYVWSRVSGTPFSAAAQTRLPAGAAIAPGESHHWDVPMTAPLAPGTYRGYWRMERLGGALFGNQVWVEIMVDTLPGDGGLLPGDGGVADGGTPDGGALTEDGGVAGDGGVADGGTPDGGAASPPGGGTGGCGCAVSQPTVGWLGIFLILVGLLKKKRPPI